MRWVEPRASVFKFQFYLAIITHYLKKLLTAVNFCSDMLFNIGMKFINDGVAVTHPVVIQAMLAVVITNFLQDACYRLCGLDG